MDNPLATFTIQPAVHILGQPGFLPTMQPLPIDNNAGFVGVPILFQWIAITPEGNLVASDIFGYKIGSPPTQAVATLSGPAAMPQATEEKLVAARKWLRKQRQPGAHTVGASMLQHLRSGSAEPWRK